MTRKTARTVRPANAHSAPHAPGTPPVPGSPAAAVYAALAANPGAATTVIADAAGISRPAARDALAALEAAGAATRVKGGKPGIPDTWTLAGPPAEAKAGATPSPDGAPPQPGDIPGTEPGEAGADEEPEDATPNVDGPAPGHAQEDDAEASTAPAPAPEVVQAAQPQDDPGDGQPGQPVGSAGQDDGPGDSSVPQGEDAGPGAGGEAAPAPDPALVAEVTANIEQIRDAASAAVIVLAGGNLSAALRGLDEAYEQAAQARRALKAATGGRKTPSARPGGLREKVLAHLDAYPGKEFTPHEIHKVIDHSSGAIANALDTLVKLGEAEVATEKPRRFRRITAGPAPAAPGTAGGAGDDDAGDGTSTADAATGGAELAGAA